MTTWITICDTCKRDDYDASSGAPTDGECLADAVERLAANSNVKTRRVSCTMGCERACNVIVQAEGKMSYSLGKFEASDESAAALLEYAGMHSESETGQVPFRQWPAGVKGHFISRHVPVPK